jgi:hypothetical protein
MIIWGGRDEARGEANASIGDGAAYDPRTDTWSLLPEAGIDPGYLQAGGMTSGGFVVFVYPNGVGQSLDGLRLEQDSWVPIPGERLDSLWTSTPLFADEHVIFNSVAQRDPPAGISTGEQFLAAYDVVREDWETIRLEAFPGHVGDGVWTGEEFLSYSGGVSLALDPFSLRTLPPHPRGPTEFYTAVWTGNSMLVWGSGGPLAPGASLGLAFTPSG